MRSIVFVEGLRDLLFQRSQAASGCEIKIGVMVLCEGMNGCRVMEWKGKGSPELRENFHEVIIEAKLCSSISCYSTGNSTREIVVLPSAEQSVRVVVPKWIWMWAFPTTHTPSSDSSWVRCSLNALSSTGALLSLSLGLCLLRKWVSSMSNWQKFLVHRLTGFTPFQRKDEGTGGLK